MVDLDIINGTIAEWESKDLTFVVVERLAWLYIVRDHILMNKTDDVEIKAMPAFAMSSGSEFMEVCEDADPIKMWSVLDDLMNTVKQLQPRLYEATIDSLKNL